MDGRGRVLVVHHAVLRGPGEDRIARRDGRPVLLGERDPDIANGPAVVPHIGDGPLHARYERLQPGYAPQHVLLEVHHQQRGALRVEDVCLVAHAFSFMVGWTGSLCCA